MLFRTMKTTLMIPDVLYRKVKREAAGRRTSISSVVAELLQTGLRASSRPRPALEPLPTFDMGTPRVDLADRDALERVMSPAPER